MPANVFQRIYTKLEAITKATVTLRATGVSNEELARVAGRLAQVVKINKTLSPFRCSQVQKVFLLTHRWNSLENLLH